MSLCRSRLDGPRIDLPRPHVPAPPDARQRERLRHARWLFLSEVGILDPATGRVRPHSTAEIAELVGLSVRTVQVGIAAARDLRARIDRVAEAL